MNALLTLEAFSAFGGTQDVRAIIFFPFILQQEETVPLRIFKGQFIIQCDFAFGHRWLKQMWILAPNRVSLRGMRTYGAELEIQVVSGSREVLEGSHDRSL